MELVDIVTPLSFVLLIATIVFIFIAKKRQERNEPIFGWKRRQFLEEQKDGALESSKKTNNINESKKKKQNKNKNEESIRDLLEVKNIEYGIVERDKNQFCLVLGTDYVNFDLLRRSEQQSILAGYQQLFKVINFPIQIFALSIRQDFRKERIRFDNNLRKCNPQTVKYNEDVLKSIEDRTINQFRVSTRIYYIVSYIYEPSKMAKLTKEQKEKAIQANVYQRAETVRRALRRAKVEAHYTNSLEALNVLKQSLNRERMLLHPIEDVALKEKTALYVTLDASSLPDIESLISKENIEEGDETVVI